MSRSERLLHLLQILRRYRHAVSGQTLADELGIGLRTLYRDIASLKAQGAAIEGGVGVGYLMKPGFMLPPLMFGSAELEALVLGMRLVTERGDRELAQGALAMLAKISAVVPPALRRQMDVSALLVGVGPKAPNDRADTALLREGIRLERKLELTYRSPAGTLSQRLVWPFALAPVLARQANAEVVMPATLMPWGNTSALLRDPEGTLVNLFSRGARLFR